jgi:hypothetical protein
VGKRSGHGPDDPEDLAALLEPVGGFDRPESEQESDVDDEPVELPFVHVPPSPADVDAAAGAAALLRQIDTLREYLGESGKAPTDSDAKLLVELLDTGDDVTNATERLPGLHSIVRIATEASAVRVDQARLIPVDAWSGLSATERATAVYRAIVEIGPLGSRGQTYELFDTVDAVLDGGTVYWLAGLLAPDSEADVDDIVEQVEPVLRDEIGPYWPQWSDTIEQMAHPGITQIFETLAAAGVVEWIEEGQTIRITALGQHVVPDDLAEAGYVLRRADNLADASAPAMINALDWVAGEQRQMLLDSWQPCRDVAERVGQIVGAIADDATLRLNGFAALALFEPEAVGPAVRGLFDGPAAGHAALYLLSRGLANVAEAGKFVDTPALVDVLAAAVDDPEELCKLFAAAPHADDRFATLERMWRHSAPETQSVLDALGQHLEDRTLAKAARKAAVKHRSWMANRNG